LERQSARLMEPPSKRRKVDNGSKRVNGDGKAVVEEEDGLGVMQQQLCIVPDHSRSSWNATQSLRMSTLMPHSHGRISDECVACIQLSSNCADDGDVGRTLHLHNNEKW
jgi:hypothetical protein